MRPLLALSSPLLALSLLATLSACTHASPPSACPSLATPEASAGAPVSAARARRPAVSEAAACRAETDLLPDPFPVFVANDVPVNHPVDGFAPAGLPTDSSFKDAPGCYVACYTHDANAGVYGVGGDIYVAGQVRVPGRYDARICVPSGYEGKDISRAQDFSALCAQKVAACGNGCWAGGDTGGWFGLQADGRCL
jgi:hypothetical protein